MDAINDKKDLGQALRELCMVCVGRPSSLYSKDAAAARHASSSSSSSDTETGKDLYWGGPGLEMGRASAVNGHNDMAFDRPLSSVSLKDDVPAPQQQQQYEHSENMTSGSTLTQLIASVQEVQRQNHQLQGQVIKSDSQVEALMGQMSVLAMQVSDLRGAGKMEGQNSEHQQQHQQQRRL